MSKFCVVGVEMLGGCAIYADGMRFESRPVQMAPRVCDSLGKATSLVNFLHHNRHSYREYGIDDIKDLVVYEVGDDCLDDLDDIDTDLIMAKALMRYDYHFGES